MADGTSESPDYDLIALLPFIALHDWHFPLWYPQVPLAGAGATAKASPNLTPLGAAAPQGKRFAV